MKNEEITGYIANRLKLIRQIRGLTLEKTAKKLGVSRKQIQNYETCTCSIPITRLFQLANALNININFFFDGLSEHSPIFDNDELQMINTIKKIKDSEVRKRIINLIKELAA